MTKVEVVAVVAGLVNPGMFSWIRATFKEDPTLTVIVWPEAMQVTVIPDGSTYRMRGYFIPFGKPNFPAL